MTSPVVELHRTLGRVFDLGPPSHPISVRDQLVRGVLLADGLATEVLHSASGGPPRVVVVAGGVAGFAAAIRWVAHDLLVALREESANPFEIPIS